MKKINISLLDIAGSIDENTPLVVLEEICNAHNIAFIDIQPDLYVEKFAINVPFLTIEDRVNASKLINGVVLWGDAELQNSFEFITNFYERPFYTPNDTDFGLSTPLKPYCYNATMCYRLLREKKLNIDRFMTFQELINIVVVAYGSPSRGRTIVYSLLSNLDSEALSSIYIYGLNKRAKLEDPYDFSENDDEISEPNNYLDELSYSSISRMPELYDDESFVLGKIEPLSDAEAIFLSATNFQIDISKAKQPIKEYKLLRSDPYAYIPLDVNLKNQITKISPFVLNLNYFFNPYLPQALYLESSLRVMATFEGYKLEDLALEDAYSLLQTSCFSDTFHTGIFYNVKNKITLEYEDVNELPVNVIVFFGNAWNSVYVFRIRELDKHFRKERCFKNPVDGSLFSILAVRKLKNICALTFPQDMEAAYNERRSLIGTIDFIEVYTAGNMQKLKELYEIYETSDDQEAVRNVVTSLVELGMYMRGWEGEGEYPIEMCIVHNQINTDLFVTTAIREFEFGCAELGLIGDLIRNLPLLRYIRGNFISSNNDQEGKTIQERLNIVKAGENASAVFSCIRLTFHIYKPFPTPSSSSYAHWWSR